MRVLSFYLILFAVPFFLRLCWALIFAPVPYLFPDEYIYPSAGKLYITGLVSGDLTVFKVNAEHPPLSKLITGITTFLLAPHGLSDIAALRAQSCFFSSLTCMVAYFIGSRYDRWAGLLSWVLLSFDPLSIRFGIASLDVTSLLFVSLSVYTFVQNRQDYYKPIFFSGLLLGLAGLCKYSAYPIVLGTFALIMFSRGMAARIVSQRMLLLALISAVVLVLGNPLLWPPQLTGFSGYSTLLEASSRYTAGAAFWIVTPLDWLEPALNAWNTPHAIFYLSMFAHGMVVHPFPLFQSSFLPWFLMFCIVDLWRGGAKLEGLRLEILLWFSAGFLFFWLLVKSQSEPYYSVWLQPPLAIFSAILIVDVRRRLR